MTERTPEYQTKIKAHLKKLGYDPKIVDKLHFSSDQEAYEYGLYNRQRVVDAQENERRRNMAERAPIRSANLSFMKGAVVDHLTGEGFYVVGDTYVGSDRILEIIDRGKALNQTREDYLRQKGVIK